MQDDLFGALALPPTPAAAPGALPSPASVPPRERRGSDVLAATQSDEDLALAARLPRHLRLGTSSWSYPGWVGLVWQRDYPESRLSRHGLPAYAQHPLMRTVGIDRGFYRPLSASEYARYAAQVPDDFRFVVKAPSLVTDALVRAEDGRGQAPNPAFMDAALAASQFVQPALEGLGHKTGALVFQFSPLPLAQIDRMPQWLARLRTLLQAQVRLQDHAPDAILAVEVRDPELLTPALAEVLRECGATYCLGLHAKMPALQEQLPLLRALWPGPMVCRWNLNPLHGAYGYEAARGLYSPYDRIVDADEATRALLARTARAIAAAGQNVTITISNKAEGCAPLSARALAEAIAGPPG